MSRRPNLTAQRALVLSHLIGMALFFGGTASVLLLVHAGEQSEAKRVFALELAFRLQNVVLLPGAVAVAASGVLMSATGAWGFIRHWWMVAKLVGSVLLTFHSQVEYRPLTGRLYELAGAGAGALPSDWGDQIFHLQRVGVIQLVVLVALSALGLFKPFGKTPFGRKKGD